MIYVDLTEIVRIPLRSGIQRVEREAIRHWDGPRPIPCVVDGDGRFLRLSSDVFDVLCGENDGSLEAREAERMQLSALREAGEPLADDTIEHLLNLELFFDP